MRVRVWSRDTRRPAGAICDLRSAICDRPRHRPAICNRLGRSWANTVVRPYSRPAICNLQSAICNLLLLALLAPAGAAPGIGWMTDYQAAMARARKGRLPILVDFTADWCGPCRAMGETTFKDPRVVASLRQIVCVRVNVDQNRRLAEQYQVSGIPRVVVLDNTAKRVVDLEGYNDADAFIEALKGAGLARLPAGKQAPADPVAALIEQLGSPERPAREQAAKGLRAMGDKVVPRLVRALDDEQLAVRIGAYSLLQEMKKLPAGFTYDPWAPKSERRKAVGRLAGG